MRIVRTMDRTNSLTRTTSAVESSAALYSALVLDASGSMADVARDALEAVADHVDQIKATAAVSRTSLLLFDDETRVLQRSVLAAELDYISRERFDGCGGGTQLYDAVMDAIRILDADGRDGARHVVAAVTDGGDTGSRVPLEELVGAVEARKARGWRFIFVGPGGPTAGVAMGFERGDCLSLAAGGPAIKAAIAEVTRRTVAGLLGPAPEESKRVFHL